MKNQHRFIVCFVVMTFSAAAGSSPVRLTLALQTVDPCKIAPERCKPSGPIEPQPPGTPPEPAPDRPNPPPPPPNPPPPPSR
jgi:hypothetical protein